jgi:hypothetical protein
LFLSTPYPLLIEKADSFKFAPRDAKNRASCSSAEVSNRKERPVLRSDFVQS